MVNLVNKEYKEYKLLEDTNTSIFDELSNNIKIATKAGVILLMSAVSTNAMASEVEPLCGLVGEQFYSQQDKENINQYESEIRAISFLKKFPDSICDNDLVSVISEGEQEWVGNGQKLSKFYGYMKKFHQKDVIGLRIRNIKKYTPKLWADLYENEYPFFEKLNVFIKGEKKLDAGEKKLDAGEKFLQFLEDNS